MRDPFVSRLRRHAPAAIVCVPHHDSHVRAALGHLEGLLASLRSAELGGAGPAAALPPSLAGGAGLAAVEAVAAAIQAGGRNPAKPRRRDGHQLVALSFVHPDRAQLFAMGAAVRALGSGLLPGAPDLLAGTLHRFADTVAPPERISRQGPEGADPADLVVEAARLHGLLDLPWDDHVARLAAALPTGAGEVTLTGRLLDDHDAVVRRILGIWTASNLEPPDRYRRRR